jgi:hypothetical protein
MFVLHFHSACKQFEIFCAVEAHITTAVRSRATLDQVVIATNLNERKRDAIFASCNLYMKNEISRFIRHCIRIRKYFHGDSCKIQYMSTAVMDYDETVSELPL